MNANDFARQIQSDFLRYYDTAFEVRSSTLMHERRLSLSQEGVIYREPLIELVPRYASSEDSLRSLVDRLTPGNALPQLASFGLFAPGQLLYKHQAETYAAVTAGKNVIVTSGTGSGKTEAFLFPVLAHILAEAKADPWPESDATPHGWWRQPSRSKEGTFTAQRSGENRKPAVRALVLYPLNALVEDQLRRLRQALDSDDAHKWLDKELKGNRIYFGRYTGRSMPTGTYSSSRLSEYRDLMSTIDRNWTSVKSDADRRTYFPRPLGAEMCGRWDMQFYAPDIFITNYSMLNVMMSRSHEDKIFLDTRAWLNADPNHKLFLVIDELHSYRGTAGTEIALMLRNVLARLGIDEQHGQLRIIATSASLGSINATRNFAAEFFDESPDTFEIVDGVSEYRSSDHAGLAKYESAFAAFARTLADGTESSAADAKLQLANALGGQDSVQRIIDLDIPGMALGAVKSVSKGSTLRPVSYGILAKSMFPHEEDQLLALDGILSALGQLDPTAAFSRPLMSSRVHCFSRPSQAAGCAPPRTAT
jgi:ATP-dependent helicase YprA (DUF1998 family)